MNNYIIRESGDYIIGFTTKDLEYSISGLYVINVASDIYPLDFSGDEAADLYTAKALAYTALTGLTVNAVEQIETYIDPAHSSGYIKGDNKKSSILPSGSIVTYGISFPSPVTKLYCHWLPILYWTDESHDPAQLRHNWNGSSFIEPSPSSFTVELRNSGNTATLHTFTPDVLTTGLSIPLGTYRLRFTNNFIYTMALSEYYLGRG